uniref:EGF-like domain-containing protein n=1 Tax=Steinernema glaseri TaxID=37863 RepID=A0A1I7Z5B7_9BILA
MRSLQSAALTITFVLHVSVAQDESNYTSGDLTLSSTPCHKSTDCPCPPSYFGERCEKYCDNGILVTSVGGTQFCSCVLDYYGEECKDITCLNNGTKNKLTGRCDCTSNFMGYRCETNITNMIKSTFTHYHLNDSQSPVRDISHKIYGAMFALVWVLAVYVGCRRQIQICNSCMPDTRAAYTYPQTNSFSTGGSRQDMTDPVYVGVVHVRQPAQLTEAPPPYVPPTSQAQISGDDGLPTYEEARKLSNLGQNIAQESPHRSTLSASNGEVSRDTNVNRFPALDSLAPPYSTRF